MKLEQQVVSFENAKRLKELNVRKESLFYWCEFKDEYCIPVKTKPYVIYGKRKWKKELLISAFNVAELGEMLPNDLFRKNEKVVEHAYFLRTQKNFQGGWWMRYEDNYLQTTFPPGLPKNIPFVEARNEANCRAKMLIYLIENNLYDPQNTQKT